MRGLLRMKAGQATMHLTRLALKNFRNYAGTELTLGPGLTVFRGGNAQGKSNLLEAVAMLALTKSTRAEQERDVIRFASLEETPYTRVSGTAARRGGATVEVQVDMALAPGDRGALVFQKRLRVDGVPKPAGQAVGAIAAVLFSAEDLTIVTGSPANRRRYLDVLLSQADRGYLRALQQYQRVITQRNQLLRRIREGLARTPELAYWDGELCRLGAQVTVRRREAVDALARRAPLPMPPWRRTTAPSRSNTRRASTMLGQRTRPRLTPWACSPSDGSERCRWRRASWARTVTTFE